MNEETSEHSELFRYEDILRAVGRFIDEHDLQDVVVLQVEEGILLRGLAPARERHRSGREYVQHLFTHDDLATIERTARERRGQGSRILS